MSYPSLAPFVRARPWLYNLLKPVAKWYGGAAGYRQLGLLYDDLQLEENDITLKAVGRLPAKLRYDRGYRIRRATQLSLQHKILPKKEWTQPEDDVRYLQPLIDQIVAEKAERAELDAMEPVPKGGH